MCVKFEGKLLKEGKYWAVCVPALDVYTQGKSKKDALAMIREAVELLVDRKKIAVTVNPLPDNQFVLRAKEADDDKYLIALMLKNQRAKHGLSLQEVADRLGVSKNAYAQYEQTRAVPSITKMEEFIHAMSHNVHVVLDVLDEARVA
ncbi:MAG: type II toxin-antitoxin system HicB family antitoxin [Deltaproteobacteria bacterium]|nr:type II toxin-antitoxin system HicB family antitoxin [Deltaproteobacteria bacterium]